MAINWLVTFSECRQRALDIQINVGKRPESGPTSPNELLELAQEEFSLENDI